MILKRYITAIAMLTAVCLVVIPAQSVSEEKYTAKEWNIIINLAGKQRMLTQKMSKELLLIVAGSDIRQIDIQDVYSELLKTSAMFERILKGLQEGEEELGLRPAKNKVVMGRLKIIEGMWASFRPNVDLVLTSSGDTEVITVSSQSIHILNEVDKVVGLLEMEAMQESGANRGAVINYAGRQRMLTQKMAKEMLLVYFRAENRNNLFKSMWMFEETLRALTEGGTVTKSDDGKIMLPQTTDVVILAQLGKVKKLWETYKTVLNNTIKKGSIVKMLAINIHLLKETNIVVKMYEANRP